jgi:FAD/FMN-containing dehydrogenase
VRADACTEPDLFWALRGGGGSFGVVTAIELRLFPITEVYAGQLWWPAEAAAEVLQAWRELTQSNLPDEFATYARITHFPPIPDIPEHLRGRSFVTLFVSHLGAPAEADTLLAPLRALRPVTDTIQTIPAKALSHLHMDPEQPSASVSDGLMLATVPAEAIETLVRVAGPGADTLLLGAELFHIGGEMKRARPASGALAAIDAEYVLFAVGRAPSPQAVRAVARSVAALHTAMRPWAAREMYLNLAETERDPASFWTPQAYDRLRRVKAAVDPDDIIRSNHPIPPAVR